MNPGALVDSCIGRPGILHSNFQHRVERSRWPEPTIKPEDELVEVSLKMLGADPMMRAEEPGIQVAKDNVDHREVRVRDCVVPTNGNTVVEIPGGLKWIVPRPTISPHHCPGLHGRLNKRDQRVLLPVGDDLKPESPCHNTPTMPPIGGLRPCLPAYALSRSAFRFLARTPSDQVRILARERNGLTWMNFNGADDQRLVVDAFPLTLRRAANQRLVHLYGVLTADQVSVGAHHRRAQLVEHLEGRLIARQAQPLLELEGAHSGGTMRHKIGAPKPGGDGNLAPLDDGIRGHTCVTPTGPAADYSRAIAKAKRLSTAAAASALEAMGKAARVQVVDTGRFVREDALEVGKGLRRRQIRRQLGWHPHRIGRLPVGGNRIGMESSFLQQMFFA